MNYSRLAFAQQVLRAMASEKTAGLVGGALNMAGKAGGWALKNPGKAIGVGLGGLGLAAVGSSAYQKAKAYNTGFNPAVHQQLATPLGQ